MLINKPFYNCNRSELIKLFESCDEVYFDMDGVLFDFKGDYECITGVKWDRSDENRWERIADWGEFFEKASPMIHGMTLWELAIECGHTPIILSAIRGDKVRCMDAKLISISRHLGSQTRAILVNDPKLKQLISRPKRLLIDDSEQNCNEWNHHGGLALLIK